MDQSILCLGEGIISFSLMTFIDLVMATLLLYYDFCVDSFIAFDVAWCVDDSNVVVFSLFYA